MVSNGKKLDNLDLIRGLIINEGYFGWKNNKKCVILDNVSFGNVPLSEERIVNVYEKYPILYELDERFLVDGNYMIDGNIISKHRLLKNLSNYKGRDNALEESLRYNSNTKDIDSVVSTIIGLEMSGNSVNISQRI